MPPAPDQRPRRRWPYYLLACCLLAAGLLAYLGYRGLQPSRNLRAIFQPPFDGRQQANILVLGEDSADQVHRSDTLLVAAVDLEGKRLAAFSVPRDFRVRIPGHGLQKINAAYSLGGVELTRDTLQTALELPIHYYVLVNVAALRQLVDAMGGVMINVDKRMYYRDRSQHLLINLRPGLQRLSGAQAEGFVRYRHDALGDLKRIQRQQLFLKAVLEQVFTPGKVRRLPAVLNAFLKVVQTDLTLRDLEAIKQLASEVRTQEITTATLPGTPTTVAGISYLEPDWAGCRETVEQVLHGAKAVVAVLNGTDQEGLAARVAEYLAKEGYRINVVANAGQRAEQTQLLAYRKPDSAYEIRALLGYGEVVASTAPSEGGADIALVLGADARLPEQGE